MNSKVKSNQVPVVKIPNNERIHKINEVFYEEFRCNPTFYVRVPGRVNIIGEHIDYCGYPVLPMALEQDILVAAGLINERKLFLRNTNSKYVSFDMEINNYEEMEIKADSKGKPFWYNYVLCGIKGALEHLKNEMVNGIQLVIDGNIPPASGLSSSSALVSAACLSFLYAQNVKISKTEIASLCANSERYIGTQGGGMDQAIAFLGEKFSAQYITFQPLNAKPVALPEDAAFIVAHSLAEANKAATNDFNRRVIECRLAAKILATVTGITKDNNVITLSQVQTSLDYTLNDMVKLVFKHLPKEIYAKRDVCHMLNVAEEDLEKLYLTSNTKHLQEFKLKQRALHVYEEAMRVEDFKHVCTNSVKNGNHNMSNGRNGSKHCENGSGDKRGEILDILGKLMSDSHESLKNLYECSHDNLDHLVRISKTLNVHARLTGAGWGGCVVALCHKDKVDEYIEKIKEEFYIKHCNIDKDKVSQYVFATTPNHGALIYANQ